METEVSIRHSENSLWSGIVSATHIKVLAETRNGPIRLSCKVNWDLPSLRDGQPFNLCYSLLLVMPRVVTAELALRTLEYFEKPGERFESLERNDRIVIQLPDYWRRTITGRLNSRAGASRDEYLEWLQRFLERRVENAYGSRGLLMPITRKTVMRPAEYHWLAERKKGSELLVPEPGAGSLFTVSGKLQTRAERKAPNAEYTVGALFQWEWIDGGYRVKCIPAFHLPVDRELILYHKPEKSVSKRRPDCTHPTVNVGSGCMCGQLHDQSLIEALALDYEAQDAIAIFERLSVLWMGMFRKKRPWKMRHNKRAWREPPLLVCRREHLEFS